MTQPINKNKTFNLYGHFIENQPANIIAATMVNISGDISLIDAAGLFDTHAKDLGYANGTLSRVRTIESNLGRELTERQIDDLLSNSSILLTPFEMLFPQSINQVLNRHV